MTLNFRNLQAGTKVALDYKNAGNERTAEGLFLGFSDWREAKYGEDGPRFADWTDLVMAEAKAGTGVTSFAGLDRYLESQNLEYGKGCYALFQERDDQGRLFTFGVYRFEGKWCLGSGAERVSLREGK